jgi:hypothetical protein
VDARPRQPDSNEKALASGQHANEEFEYRSLGLAMKSISARGTFALNAGAWFRRGLPIIVSPLPRAYCYLCCALIFICAVLLGTF